MKHARSPTESLARRCLRPLRWLVIFCAFAFLAAAGFVFVVEFEGSVERARIALDTDLRDAAPALAREVLLEDNVGLEAVRQSLMKTQRFTELVVARAGVESACPSRAGAFAGLVTRGHAVLCAVAPLTRYLPGYTLRAARVFAFEQNSNGVLLVLSHLVTLSFVAGLGSWMLRRALRKHVLAPVALLEGAIHSGVDSFFSPNGRPSEIDPDAFAVREFHSIATTMREAKIRLRESVVARELLTERHAAASAVGDAARLLAHDLREPAQLTRAFLRMLREAQGEAERSVVVEALGGELEASVSFLEESVQDLLSLGAPADQACNVDVPLGALLESALRRARAATGISNGTASVDVPRGLALRGDPRRLARLFGNLIRNALEAMGPDDVLSLSASVAQEAGTAAPDAPPRAVVEVVNTGPSLDENARQRIFEPFVTGGKPGGTGIGLAVVRDIVRSHGGSVSCLPHDPSGVRFRLDLPSAPKALSPRNFGAEHATERGLSLCVVEDNAVLRAFWKHATRGVRGVSTFESPRHVRAAAAAGAIDPTAFGAFVLDGRFKGEADDATSLAAWLRGVSPAPVFLCSSEPEAFDAVAFDGSVPKSENAIRGFLADWFGQAELGG